MNVKTSGMSDQRIGFWVLFATISAASMAFVASTSLNVALPAIQVELGARGADLIWIPNAYVLVQASLIVVTGSMGDHYGRNRICLLGIFLFGLASVVCGFSTTTNIMIAGRFAQGIGSAMIVPNSMAICASYFSRKRQGWALGIWSGLTTLTTGAAPYLAGILTDMGFWRSVFFIHIPFGILAVIFIIKYVPESYNKNAPRRMSLSGAALVIAGLAGITFGFIESSTYGFTSPIIFGAIFGGILALAAFFHGERDNKHGILPLRLFKSRNLSAANVIMMLIQGTLGPVILYLPLNLIQIQGYSATATGLAVIPMTLLATICAAAIGPVVDRRGPRLPLMIGTFVLFLGFLSFTSIGTTGGSSEYFSTFFIPAALFGAGLGLSIVPTTAAALGSAPDANAGIASGVHNTMSRGGQVLVVGILGGLAITWFGQLLMDDPYIRSLPPEAQMHLAADAGDLAETSIPDTLSEIEQEGVYQVIREAFTTTYSILMWFGAGAMVICMLLAAFVINNEELKKKRKWQIDNDPDDEAEPALSF